MPYPIGEIVQALAALQAAFPDAQIDTGRWDLPGLKLLQQMVGYGPLLREYAGDIVRNGTALYETREARGVGAGWHENVSGERWISLDHNMLGADRLISLAHEAHHLRQDIRKRCSVAGEYESWRLGYKLRAELGAHGVPVAVLSPDEQHLAALPDQPSRENLADAQRTMKRIAGPGYMIHLAPLAGTDWTTAPLAFGLKIVNWFMVRGEKL
jgi:hypothetical protein